MRAFAAAKAGRVNSAGTHANGTKAASGNADTAPSLGNQGAAGRGALPRGNAVFERFGQLLVHELDREALFEVSHHPGLDLAKQHQ